MLVRVIPKNLVRSDIAIVWSCLTILHRASIFFHSVCSRWQFSAICRQAPGFKHYLCYWNLHLSIKYHLASLVASILGDLSEVTKATAVIKTTWARVCTSFRVCSNLFFYFQSSLWSSLSCLWGFLSRHPAAAWPPRIRLHPTFQNTSSGSKSLMALSITLMFV